MEAIKDKSKQKPLIKQKKVFIETLGCQMNMADTERMLGMLEEIDYYPTESFQEADLSILNTCSIREHAVDKMRSYIGKWDKLRKPGSLIAVSGCVAQQEGTDLVKEIKTLEKASKDVVTLIEHSPYCFGKILDILRIKRLHSINLAEGPACVMISGSQQKRFEKVVNFYFPGESSTFILDKTFATNAPQPLMLGNMTSRPRDMGAWGMNGGAAGLQQVTMDEIKRLGCKFW